MKVSVVIFFACFASSTSTLLEDGREAVDPEYLDYLLKEEKYEEFNRLMGIDVPHLSKPRTENHKIDPRFSPHLEHGDILLTPKQKEQARQGINFHKHPTYKWKDGDVPCSMSEQFNAKEQRYIWSCLAQCNECFDGCVILRPYDNETDKNYIHFYPGNGCYSNLGCIGGQQSLSLAKYGCLSCGTICHEALHALGFMHEHCREDRDENIHVYWENIKPEWKSQFTKVSSEDFVNIDDYDGYSIMHYPQRHPDLCYDNKPAFDFYDSDYDVSRVGYAENMTEMDKEKVAHLYCD